MPDFYTFKWLSFSGQGHKIHLLEPPVFFFKLFHAGDH
jgi:hypothetical protein